MNIPPFKNRWLITGSLTTESELHIGDGGAGALHDRTRPADESKQESDASTLCIAHNGSAYIPGSAIKGPLRALVQNEIEAEARDIATRRGKWRPGGQASRPPTPWSDLLGSDSPEDAVGGKLEFWDAFHAEGEGTKEEEPDPEKLFLNPDRKRPWWNDTRRTCVAVAVSLDRRTRTAKENLLYHIEYVPPGEKFHLEISGDNLEPEEIARVLVLLDQLNRTDAKRATLGALGSNGWGRVKWNIDEIRCFDKNLLDDWKKNPSVGLSAPRKVSDERQTAIDEAKKKVNLSSAAEQLVIGLAVAMESPWLVRDPRQAERSTKAKEKNVPEEDKPDDAVAILDESGKPFDPAKSLRGALRARAEMILRTVGSPGSPESPCRDHPADIPPVSTKGSSMEEALEKIAKLDLAARLFGLSGWRAPLTVSRLVIGGQPPAEHRQEFVAIDRFTGGAAAGAKFNAKLAGMTTLHGQLTVDLGRLKEVDPTFASLGLLALVLRDFAEGDIPIGSGSAKGQGFCTATVTIDGISDWRAQLQIVDGLKALRALQPATPGGE